VNPVGLILLALIAGGGWLWLRRQPPQNRTRAALKLALILLLLGLLLLAITGRMHWLGALVALLLPLAQRLLPLLLRLLPWLQQLKRQRRRTQRSSGRQSRVRSRMIAMTLDHDSGDIDGEVLAGPLSGRPLSSLHKEEFLDLLAQCRASDADSARLIETYLDKRFGAEWRADDPQQRRQDSAQPGHDREQGVMSRAEAYEILGLEPGAGRDEIIEAHRRLMQRNHPDRGGSTWLAARINDAKALLLKE
jgi:hypothetical protein